jgi:hypothetical protein
VAHVHILDATLRDARPLLKPAPAALGVRPVVEHDAIGDVTGGAMTTKKREKAA